MARRYKEAVGEGYAWLAGLKEVRNITWVDLPTSHWPMWSRPKELAEIIGDVAKAHPRQLALGRATLPSVRQRSSTVRRRQALDITTER
jgi:hypothetical protein